MVNISRKKLFGIEFDPLTMNQTLEKISEIIETRVITQHVVINVAKLVFSQKDEKLKKIINSCGLINVDGFGVVFGAKLLGINIPERVAGIDLMDKLTGFSAEKNYKIFFFGARQEIVENVVNTYKLKYPNLKIAGYKNGYFKEEQEQNIAAEIRESGADILFVAMGSPKKELFLNKYLHLMNVPFVMGVGGSFDVVAGKVSRAPVWMQKIGFEWFYRLIQEPKRMWKRYLYTNTAFATMIFKSLIDRESAFNS